MKRSLIQKRNPNNTTSVVMFAQCGFMPACASTSSRGTRKSK